MFICAVHSCLTCLLYNILHDSHRIRTFATQKKYKPTSNCQITCIASYEKAKTLEMACRDYGMSRDYQYVL